MGNDVLRHMCQTDITDRFNVWIEEDKVKEATEEIKSLVDTQELLEMSTWEEEYDSGLTLIGYMMYGCYGMLLVFGLIGIPIYDDSSPVCEGRIVERAFCYILLQFFHPLIGNPKKRREGYDEINTGKLTVVNLGRNKKRTLPLSEIPLMPT